MSLLKIISLKKKGAGHPEIHSLCCEIEEVAKKIKKDIRRI